ncbi:MAG: Eco57I restriction-modification methylase domain-containing protein [Bacteroidia bacterium]|nr:Eco57I restriction-modification methylase domain-containing protein [Bacteroidia bacterium]
MKLIPQSPKKALKAFLKQKPLRSEIDLFKANLIILLDKINVIEKRPKDESEEHLKNDLRDFLRDTYYKESNAINTKDKKDLVIHLGKTTDSEVGVIIEAKRPTNIGEMISADNPNKKALHELILYYLDERNSAGNNQLKQLVMTNVNEWYIIDANFFDKHIYRNAQIKKLYETKVNDKKDNPFFYEEIAKIISKLDVEIPCVYFDIREYDTILRNNKKEDDRQLSALLKILSPQHLLKIATPNDSNTLDEKFYKELLHIIGLEEAKEGGKNIIRRKKDNRNAASLIESTIEALLTDDPFHRIPDLSIYGDTKEERAFNVSLELCITWINRILFLKLLEGQLITYHQGNKDYRFLNTETIHDFDELFKLFHKVLAVNVGDRSEAVKSKYSRVPYLNSSLFEISELEDQTIKINSLDNSGQLELISTTILKAVKSKSNKLQPLDYLFQFLDAYDFASEGTEDVQEDNKTIINASVLGKVFEKINGYKDGSIFTPAFITMYMCKQSIRLAVVEKFNETLSKKDEKLFDKFDDVKNYTSRLFKTQEILKANEIINSLRICDPAVGSGHFLVSSLNEIISIKAELGILADESGNSISGYEIEIVNDELIITDPKSNILEYKLQNGKPLSKEIQRLQKALFHEKQTIIESCLFGVDINPNSVKICRLRLWIELLKNAYYREESGFTELETLPNIDINIKCGNSLLSRFALDSDLSKALKSIKYDIKAYRGFVSDYKNEKSRDVKRGLQKIIDSIKSDFRTEISRDDPKQIKLSKLGGELFTLLNQSQIFELTPKEKKAQKDKKEKLEAEIKKLTAEVEEIKSNAIYKNAFEWRFEFPEVLGNDGEFVGFDLVIGNPPYIQLQSMGNDAEVLSHALYKTFARTGDIYSLFYERGNSILKNDGYLSFITSNKWMRADYGENTRKFICEFTNPLLLIDFGMVLVFENATVLSNILMFQKSKNQQKLLAVRIPDSFDLKSSLEDYYAENLVPVVISENAWLIQDKEVQKIKTKVELQGLALKDWNIRINYGLKTGLNDAFVIDGAKRSELIMKDSKSAEIIKPLLRGRDIQKYHADYNDLWLLFIPWHFPLHKDKSIQGASTIAETEFQRQYPAIYDHLLGFKEKLSARNKAETGIRYEWYCLQRFGSNYFEDFEKEKIIYPNMTKFLPFVFDKGSFYTNQKCFIITGEHLGYLTAMLNSKLFRYCFRNNFPELLGETRELSKVFFEQIKIKKVSDDNEKEFLELVETIQAMKTRKEDTTNQEFFIEQKIASFYELSEDEFDIVNNAE